MVVLVTVVVVFVVLTPPVDEAAEIGAPDPGTSEPMETGPIAELAGGGAAPLLLDWLSIKALKCSGNTSPKRETGSRSVVFYQTNKNCISCWGIELIRERNHIKQPQFLRFQVIGGEIRKSIC